VLSQTTKAHRQDLCAQLIKSGTGGKKLIATHFQQQTTEEDM
jgi:hypothetical protein